MTQAQPYSWTLRRFRGRIRLQGTQNGVRSDMETRPGLLPAVRTKSVARRRDESQAPVPHWTPHTDTDSIVSGDTP